MGSWANLFHNNIIITYFCQTYFYFDTPAFFALKIHNFPLKLIFTSVWAISLYAQ